MTDAGAPATARPAPPSRVVRAARPTPAAGGALRAGLRAAIGVGASLLAACDRGAADERTSYVEQAVALAPEVERATGLRFTTPPKVELRSAAQVRDFVRRALDEPEARAELDGVAAAYRRLGMLDEGTDLREILVRVLGEQVAGYYDPRTKTLYLVQGADSAATTVTLRHELVHALQDQHQNLDSLLQVRGQGDRTTGAQAALEGQATWAMFGPAGLAVRAPGGWERVRQTIRQNMEQMPALSGAPLIVRETLLFPYLSGAELARAVAATGHPDSLVRRLPTSTEQVLHVERYLDGDGTPPDAPMAVTLPAPRVGSLRAQNTLGEFETRLVLFQHLADLGTAAQAAGGWGGDRWAVVETPQGEAFVWVSAWDTPVDAAQFYDALGQWVPKRYPTARAAAGATTTTARPFTVDAAAGGAGGRAVLVRAGEAGGRPVVLYVDAPAGAGTDLVDLARVTVGR